MRVICGPKGSGKTKDMIRSANEAAEVCKGNIVYVTDSSDDSRSVSTAIRFVNVRDYGKINGDMFLGFVKGIIASNADVKRIYVDGLARILGTDAADLEELFLALDDTAEHHRVDFTVSVTCDKPPKFLKKYL